MDLKYKKLYEDTIIPTQGSAAAAGYDLYAHIPSDAVEILPHKTIKIGTGIAIALPDGTFGGIFARSGLASKKGLRPANCTGVIDSDYRGEVIVALHNDSDKIQTIENSERIAQLIILNYTTPTWTEVEDLDETDRGQGGFGSTGTN